MLVRRIITDMKNTLSEIGDAIENVGYMLFFRGEDWDEGVSLEEVQKRMDRVTAWFNQISESGKVKGGQPLARQGQIISGRNGSAVSDGPFAESKEAIGGYLWLDVDTIEEATAIARACPTLDYGISIEVRPVLADCPVFKRVRQRREFVSV